MASNCKRSDVGYGRANLVRLTPRTACYSKEDTALLESISLRFFLRGRSSRSQVRYKTFAMDLWHRSYVFAQDLEKVGHGRSTIGLARKRGGWRNRLKMQIRRSATSALARLFLPITIDGVASFLPVQAFCYAYQRCPASRCSNRDWRWCQQRFPMPRSVICPTFMTSHRHSGDIAELEDRTTINAQQQSMVKYSVVKSETTLSTRP